MSTRRNTTTLYYVIAIAVIVIAFLLLDGGTWIKGMGHGGGSMNMASLNWVQILISLAIGFLLGVIATRRKWF